MILIRSESILSKLEFQSPVVVPPPLKLVQPRPSWLDGDVLPIVENSLVKEDVALPQALLLLEVVRAAEVGSAQVLHHQVQGAKLLTFLNFVDKSELGISNCPASLLLEVVRAAE